MKNLSLKKVKFKNLYKWPIRLQSIVGTVLAIIILIAGLIFVIKDQYTTLTKQEAKEETLKIDFLEKTKQAVNLNLYKEQLIEITQASDALLKQLPNKSEVEKLLIDINQSGIGRGLTFDLFKPGTEKMTEYYAELPISIKVNGTYDAIGHFASDVSQLSRVVILKNINLVNHATNPNLLTMTAIAQTFRYLDQEEIDKQKAEKKAKEKKPSKSKKIVKKGEAK